MEVVEDTVLIHLTPPPWFKDNLPLNIHFVKLPVAVKALAGHLTLSYTIQLLMTLDKKALENIVGKGENAGHQHFLLFPQCLLPYQGHKSSF